MLWLLATVLALNALFLLFIFYRRLGRKRYYEDKDSARSRYTRVVAEFVENEISADRAVQLLEEASSRAEHDAVQEMLLAQEDANNAERISQVFFGLGYVEGWARQAFGGRAKALVQRSMKREKAAISTKVDRNLLTPIRKMKMFSVPRSVAVEALGRLAPEYAQVFIAEALHDPASEVRRVAIAAMGRNRHPAAIPLLFDELLKAVEMHNDVSLRSTKSALVCYTMDDLRYFVPYLTHPNRRMRFFVVDTVREICNKASRHMLLNKNDFPQDLYDCFLDLVVKDEFPDVRARSAAVIKHFRDKRAIQALRTLLSDENDFVRLHSVRACQDRYYMELVPDMIRRLADTRWRVRESAVKALAAFGTSGSNELYRYFIATKDQYVSEQITEEVQRAGLTADIVAALAHGGDDRDLGMAVAKKMTLMGKTSLLVSAVAGLTEPEPRILLMDALVLSPTDEFLTVLDTIANNDPGPVGDKARGMLQELEQRASATVGMGRA
ncbi:MAG TPA: HEAT repeat domain-containing protein [Terriglobales bacterium]|nr:HEAT repeat domain-containing protein [Terriglobales bacterium]